ncbi:cell surface glycoprotein 1-like isoform X4 [Amphibalanus amphitrite]|uniref:cell surface glycoprotein 1-like isoform X4 n=1 Tax=Amphibalanus amphitrite TaxID=1232801 RepID=UPI001C8FBE01|nr:cell surface glycoprotein 1-like isoform X4 [Amphibalanus amphitrite]
MVPACGLPLTCAVLLAAAVTARAARPKPEPYLDWLTLHRTDPGEPERRILVTVVPDPQHDYVRHPVPGSPWSPAPIGTGPPLQPGELAESEPSDQPVPQLLSTQRPPRPDSELRQQTPALEPAGDPRQQTPALQPDSELRQQTPALQPNSELRQQTPALQPDSDPLQQTSALQPAEESGQPEWTRDLPAEWTDRYPVASAYMDSYQSYTSEPSRSLSQTEGPAGGPQLYSAEEWQDGSASNWLTHHLPVSRPVVTADTDSHQISPSEPPQSRGQSLTDQLHQAQHPWSQHMPPAWLQSPLFDSEIEWPLEANTFEPDDLEQQAERLQEEQAQEREKEQEEEGWPEEQQKSHYDQQERKQPEQQQKGQREELRDKDEKQHADGEQDRTHYDWYIDEDKEETEYQNMEYAEEEQEEDEQTSDASHSYETKEQDYQEEIRHDEQSSATDDQRDQIREPGNGQIEEQPDDEQLNQPQEGQDAEMPYHPPPPPPPPKFPAPVWLQQAGITSHDLLLEGERYPEPAMISAPQPISYLQTTVSSIPETTTPMKSEPDNSPEATTTFRSKTTTPNSSDTIIFQEPAIPDNLETTTASSLESISSQDPTTSTSPKPAVKPKPAAPRSEDTPATGSPETITPTGPKATVLGSPEPTVPTSPQQTLISTPEPTIAISQEPAAPSSSNPTATSAHKSNSTNDLESNPTSTTELLATSSTESTAASDTKSSLNSSSESNSTSTPESLAPSPTRRPDRRPGSLLSRLVGPLLTWQDRPSGQRLLRYLANPLSSEHWTQQRRRRSSDQLETHSPEPSPAETSTTETSSAETSATEASSVGTTSTEPLPAETSATKPSPAEISSTEPSLAPTSSTEPSIAPTTSPEPSIAPTTSSEPSIAPTESSVAPTESSFAPTASTEPSLAPTASTEPSLAPTEPPLAPNEPPSLAPTEPPPAPTASTDPDSLQSEVVEASGPAGPPPAARCGVTSDQPTRIVGGAPAAPDRWPWMAALVVRVPWYGSWVNCGGALISGRHVLTAAHCLYSITRPSSLRSLVVRLGEYRLYTAADGPHLDLTPISITIHPAYEHYSQRFDFGIVTLPYDVTVHTAANSGLAEDLLPICLPTAGEQFVGQNGTILGWGNLYESGYQSSILHEVTVPIWNQTACQHAYREDSWGVGPDAFCAGLPHGGKDSCQGDSGGPLMVRAGPDQLWTVAGLVSWGEGCARPEFPGVYSNVAAARDWIDSVLEHHE